MKKFLSLTLLSLLVFTACSAKSEKQRFTDATVEATCMVFEAGNINDPELETKAKAIYEDHGFDVEDEKAMEDIAAKYQNDPDVQKAVQDALKECASDLLNGGADTTPTEEPVVEGEATETTDESTTPKEEGGLSEEDKAATEAETEEVK